MKRHSRALFRTMLAGGGLMMLAGCDSNSIDSQGIIDIINAAVAGAIAIIQAVG